LIRDLSQVERRPNPGGNFSCAPQPGLPPPATMLQDGFDLPSKAGVFVASLNSGAAKNRINRRRPSTTRRVDR